MSQHVVSFDRYLLLPHFVQGVPLSAGHSKQPADLQGTHAFASAVDEYLPAVQAEHVASFLMGDPFQPSPEGHDETLWAEHGDASSAAEYWPAMQSEHEASLVADPATKPWPLGQVTALQQVSRSTPLGSHVDPVQFVVLADGSYT